jgi:hypothetical protein
LTLPCVSDPRWQWPTWGPAISKNWSPEARGGDLQLVQGQSDGGPSISNQISPVSTEGIELKEKSLSIYLEAFSLENIKFFDIMNKMMTEVSSLKTPDSWLTPASGKSYPVQLQAHCV